MKGEYEAEKDGWLLLTIPYDEGWKIRVNGETILSREGANALTVIPVNTGINEIEMKYQAPGGRAGIIITCCSALLLAVWCILEKKRKSREV